MLRRVDMILEGICPQYCESGKPSTEENLLHVRYIFKVWNDVSEPERSRLKAKISEIPILRAYGDIEREVYDFVVPRDAYLPKVYTDDGDLETYFSVYDESIWFVDDAYLEDKSDVKVWFRFLKIIGSKDTPVVIEGNISRNSENHQEFNKELAKRDIVWERTTRWPKTSIEDFYLQGLLEALDKISKHGKVDLARVIWQLLVKIVKPLPSEESQRNNFFRTRFQGIYRWFYYSNRSKLFDATFYRQLKSTAWIPDEKGNLHTPSECFAPTSENRKVLGDSVVYLPANFDISTESARWLAEKLGVRMEADPESVLNHLQKLRDDKEVSIKKIEPLYRFLYSARPRRKIITTFDGSMVDAEPRWRSNFKKEPLIFTSNPEPCWWRVDEVFWEDESVVFGNDRGYLKSHYVKDLKPFFTGSLAVSERATASDYIDRIQTIKLMEQVMNEEIRILYERLWQVMQESSSTSSNRLDVNPREKFTEESLIFTPNPEPRWWRVNKVFWEDESVVFGDHRGYLKAYYPEKLKPFFTALGILGRAAPLDYVRGIQEFASVEQVDNLKIHKRIKRLYTRVWQALQEDGTWQETEEWKQTSEGKYWLGKKGSAWGFFSRYELLYNDHHDYITEIFEGEVPFWAFDDLLEFARNLEIKGCSQAEIEFNPKGDQEELTNLSEEVRNLRPYIHAFLNSPRLCEVNDVDKSAHVLDSLSVCLVEELETVYTLKDISLTSTNPRPSFLNMTDREGTLWLALAADKDDYILLIGDALQDYFGIKDLGRFTEHLLTKSTEKVLEHWKREGLRTELCELLLKTDAKEDVEKQSKRVDEEFPDESKSKGADVAADESEVEISINNEMPETDYEDSDSGTNKADESETHISSDEGNDSTADESDIETAVDNKTLEIVGTGNNSTSDRSEIDPASSSDIENKSSSDMQVSTKVRSATTQLVDRESKSEGPTVNTKPEIGTGDVNLETKGSDTGPYTPSKTSNASRSGGHSLSTSGGKSSRGGHGGGSGGGEGEEHENLKRDLANNPSQFGEGIKLVKIEHTFGSGDRVDILLKDRSENPVTVEVETGFSSGSGR